MQVTFRYFHVQTACESPNLNVDFLSFDNGLNALRILQEHYGKSASNVNLEPKIISYVVCM